MVPSRAEKANMIVQVKRICWKLKSEISSFLGLLVLLKNKPMQSKIIKEIMLIINPIPCKESYLPIRKVTLFNMRIMANVAQILIMFCIVVAGRSAF